MEILRRFVLAFIAGCIAIVLVRYFNIDPRLEISLAALLLWVTTIRYWRQFKTWNRIGFVGLNLAVAVIAAKLFLFGL